MLHGGHFSEPKQGNTKKEYKESLFESVYKDTIKVRTTHYLKQT